MTKVYYVYILNGEHDIFEVPYISKDSMSRKFDNGRHYTLYAFTTKKELIEEFKATRNMDRFIISEHLFDKRHLKSFRKVYRELKLDHYELVYSRYAETKVLITQHEYGYLDGEHHFYHDMIGTVGSKYHILKDKYIDELDRLLYCTYHELGYSDDDTMDWVSSNFYGYNITVGNRTVSSDVNQLSILLDVFGGIFDK